MNNYIKTLISRMALTNHIELTEEHNRILDYAYRYYQKNKVGPLYYNFKKKLGISKTQINRLFPHGLYSIYNWVDIPLHSAHFPCKSIPTIEVNDYRQVYLDYNATSFIRDEVKKVLSNYYSGNMGFGNPSSSTEPGRQAWELVNSAHEQLAQCLQVDPGEIVFTGCGTEANNLAIKGIALNHYQEKGHIITANTEHSSVLRTVQYMETLGYDVTILNVDHEGFVDPDDVARHLKKNTILVSIMAANNEIGTIHPIPEIGKICKTAGVPLMVDAIQAFGRIPLPPKKLGISLMSVSGHKIYGPKGVGALYVDKDCHLTPLLHGGRQESGLRSGTENVGHILAMAAAARLMTAEMSNESARLRELRDYFIDHLYHRIPGIIVNGSLQHRLPHNLSIGFPGIDSGSFLLGLNKIGIYVSSGSACSEGSRETSHVLQAIGVDKHKYGTIRFSFGLQTTQDDLDYVLKYVPVLYNELIQTQDNILPGGQD